MILGLGAVVFVFAILSWFMMRRSARWKSEAYRYRSVLDSIPLPVIVSDSELRIIEGNEAARTQLGAGKHARRSQNLVGLLDFGEQVTPERLAHRIRESGHAQLDASQRSEEGSAKRLRVQVRRIEIASQSRLVSVAEDISEAHRQAMQYESFLDHLIRNVPAEVAILSTDGHYHYLSSTFIPDERRREWLIGKTDFDYCRESGMHVEVALRRRAHRLEAVDRRETVHFEEAIEVNGKERKFSWRYCPFIDENGSVSMVLGFGVDITELSRCRTELRQAEEEVQKASRLKEALIQNVSHEIRTPLSSIIATAQMLQPDVPDSIRDFLENIEQSGHRLADTLNEMLDLAGLQAESLEIRPEILNLSTEMMELGRSMRSAVERRGLFLKVSAGEPEILVKADHSALYRCVKSLVDNAAKFTSEGGVLLEISQGMEFAYIRVMDTGVGIDEDIQEEVFEAFSQEDSGLDRSFEGLGLGLAVTRRLLSMMDADIRVHSRKGAGSSFVIRLPLVVPELRRRTDIKPRILIADSHREVHRLLRHMLGDYFEFESAFTLAEASSLFSARAFESVLVDGGIHAELDPTELLLTFREGIAGEPPALILMDHRRHPKRKKEIQTVGWSDSVSKPLQKLEVLNVLYAQAAMALTS